MKFARKDLNLLITARFLCVVGDEAALLATLFKLKPHGAMTVSLLFIGLSSAIILTSNKIGYLVDRFPSRKILIFASFIQALICVAMLNNHVSILLISNFFLGIGQSLILTTTAALIPSLTEGKNVTKSFGHLQTTYAMGGLFGYGIGGFLIGRFSPNFVLEVNVISFLIAIPLIFMMKNDRVPLQKSESVQHAHLNGFKSILSNKKLKDLAFFTFIFGIAFRIFTPVEIFMATDILGMGATGFGIITMVWSSSLAVGSLCLSRIFKDSTETLKLMTIYGTLAGTCLFFISRTNSVYQFAFLLFLLGVAISGVNLLIGPTVALFSSNNEIGKVNSSFAAINSLGRILGMLIGGFLGTMLSIRFTIFTSAILLSMLSIYMGMKFKANN